MLKKVKVAWIRDRSAPPGQPGPGRLNCDCGHAPPSRFHPDQVHVNCRCGRLYSWDGWLLEEVRRCLNCSGTGQHRVQDSQHIVSCQKCDGTGERQVSVS
jgi:hypothetical protein